MGVVSAARALLVGLLVAGAMGCADDQPTSDEASDAGEREVPTDRDAAPGDVPDAAPDAAADSGGVASDADAGGSVSPQADAGQDGSAALPDAGGDVPLPRTLAETGLYLVGSTTELAEGVLPYSPAYALWSDGADKERWLLLPEGAQIDTSDMAYWTFPIGTKAWKQFSRGGKRLETRLLWKTEMGWFRMAYVWNEAGTEAVEAPDGMENVLGTDHDVPARGDCSECHDGVPDRLLGIGSIQSSGARPGLTLDALVADGRLSAPPPGDFALPDELAWNALGYLHANCGNCHNPTSDAYDRLDLDLWLRPEQLGAVAETESYKTSVGQLLTDTDGPTYRIEGGAPDQSGLVFRMSMRGAKEAMPPLGSEQVDADGIKLVSDWIETLPAP